MADPLLVDEADRKVKQKLSMPYVDGPPIAAFNIGTRQVTRADGPPDKASGLKLQPITTLPDLKTKSVFGGVTPGGFRGGIVGSVGNVTGPGEFNRLTVPQFTNTNTTGLNLTGSQSNNVNERVASYNRATDMLRAPRQRALELRADRTLAMQSRAAGVRADMAREDAMQRAFVGDTQQARLKLAEADAFQERSNSALELVNQRETARREQRSQLQLGKQTDEATAQRQQAEIQLKQQQFDAEIAFNERKQDKQIAADLEIAKIRRESQSQITPQQQKQIQDFVATNIFAPDQETAAVIEKQSRPGTTLTTEEEVRIQQHADKVAVGSMVAQAMGNLNNAEQIRNITDVIMADPDRRLIFELGDLQEQQELIMAIQQAAAEQLGTGKGKNNGT